jgi:hypothetical protein
MLRGASALPYLSSSPSRGAALQLFQPAVNRGSCQTIDDPMIWIYHILPLLPSLYQGFAPASMRRGGGQWRRRAAAVEEAR